jgi:hypothetical protein
MYQAYDVIEMSGGFLVNPAMPAVARNCHETIDYPDETIFRL